MKKVVFITLLGLLSVVGYSQKATDNFAGKWKTEKGIIIDIAKNGNSFNGTAGARLVLDDLHYTSGVWKGTFIRPLKNEKNECTAIVQDNKIKITIKSENGSETIVWIKQ